MTALAPVRPGERFFRRPWLGPPGIAFVRLGVRRAAVRGGSTTGRRSATPAVAPGAIAAWAARAAEPERWRGRR